jgi:hypothetical protein
MRLAKYLSVASDDAVALFCGNHEHRPAPNQMLLVGDATLKTSPVPPSISSNLSPNSEHAYSA